MKKPSRCELLRGERGASLVEFALLLPIFVILLLACVDFGRAFYLATEIAGAARAGAVYGTRNPTDTLGMQTVAQDDTPDVPNVSAGTPTYVCECADGTNQTSAATCATSPPTCSNGLNWVYMVTVTVTGTYTPLLPWPGIPSPMNLSTTASMRSAGS
jgi:Flp pilus assembly protein TadG